MERDDLTSCSWVMVELSTRKREIRGDGGNHHETLGLKRISCASQFTIPDTAGTSLYPAGNHMDTRSSKPNQVSCTPDFSGALGSSTSYSSASPISLFLVHNSTIMARTQSQVILSISPFHHHELTLSASYTECSIHRVQHTPKTVCCPFILTISS